MNRTILIVAAIAVFVGFVITAGTFDLAPTNPLFLLFFGSGLFGCYVMAQKGYLARVSIVLFLLVGWWFIAILIGLGPITLLIAALLPEKKRCPHCREIIDKHATRCPKCQGEIGHTPKDIFESNSTIGWIGKGIIVATVGIAGLSFFQNITSSLLQPTKTKTGRQAIKQETKKTLPIPTFTPTPTTSTVFIHEGWKTLEAQTYTGQKFTVQYPPEYAAKQEKDINCPAEDGPCTYAMLMVTDGKGQHAMILGMKYIGTPYGEKPAQQPQVETLSFTAQVVGKAYTVHADKAQEGITSTFAPTQFHPGYAFTGNPVFTLQSESNDEAYLRHFLQVLETIQLQ